MLNPQPVFNSDLIDKAIEAAREFRPESIDVFRELSEIDAAIVIRVLRQDQPPAKPAKKKRSDAGTTRGPKTTGAQAS